MSAAQRGAAALVPAPTCQSPRPQNRKPVCGSAFDATSGTPRPRRPFDAFGTRLWRCHDGCGNITLTPPPLAPVLLFHTDSDTIRFRFANSVVPPQASAYGLDAGKVTCGTRSCASANAP